jgi:hypothetical protein
MPFHTSTASSSTQKRVSEYWHFLPRSTLADRNRIISSVRDRRGRGEVEEVGTLKREVQGE